MTCSDATMRANVPAFGVLVEMGQCKGHLSFVRAASVRFVEQTMLALAHRRSFVALHHRPHQFRHHPCIRSGLREDSMTKAGGSETTCHVGKEYPPCAFVISIWI